jgi:chitin synthase
MAAAFLEWFLWIAAFDFCLFKAYQKAEHYTVKILAVLIGIFFTLLRYELHALEVGWYINIAI